MPSVYELEAGLWHWQSPHPEWREDAAWAQEVSSYALDDGTQLLLIDPLGVPDELLGLAKQRRTAIVLTAPWHERDTQLLVEQLGVPLYTPPPDTQQDLMDKFGVSAERAAGGSPDLRWLFAAGGGEARTYLAGDRLPIGVEAFPGRDHNDLVLWIESRRAVVAGDTLADFGGGIAIQEEWLRGAVTREQVADGLRPLLDLPVEHVLPAHGQPSGRDELERALALDERR
jgi:glyoxylase-like metal-dependent hydrolase (beta-lactamase superfamily II)